MLAWVKLLCVIFFVQGVRLARLGVPVVGLLCLAAQQGCSGQQQQAAAGRKRSHLLAAEGSCGEMDWDKWCETKHRAVIRVDLAGTACDRHVKRALAANKPTPHITADNRHLLMRNRKESSPLCLCKTASARSWPLPIQHIHNSFTCQN